MENYFRVLGGVSFDDIVEKFDGEEKLICRSLFSWVHAGSHGLPDDIFHTLDETTMERYPSSISKGLRPDETYESLQHDDGAALRHGKCVRNPILDVGQIDFILLGR